MVDVFAGLNREFQLDLYMAAYCYLPESVTDSPDTSTFLKTISSPQISKRSTVSSAISGAGRKITSIRLPLKSAGIYAILFNPCLSSEVLVTDPLVYSLSPSFDLPPIMVPLVKW